MSGHDQPCRCSECRGEPRDADSLIAREYKRPALFKVGEVIGYEDVVDEDPFITEWRRQLEALELTSPLDKKARETILAGERSSVADLAKASGCTRKTALRHLERAERLGWLILGGEPMKAGDRTLPRVWTRCAFWSDGELWERRDAPTWQPGESLAIWQLSRYAPRLDEVAEAVA